MTCWKKIRGKKQRVQTQDNGGKQVKQNLVKEKKVQNFGIEKDRKSQVSFLVKCGCLVGKTYPIMYPLLIHVKTFWDIINLTLLRYVEIVSLGIACSQFNALVSLTTFSELSSSIHAIVCWMVLFASHSTLKTSKNWLAKTRWTMPINQCSCILLDPMSLRPRHTTRSKIFLGKISPYPTEVIV